MPFPVIFGASYCEARQFRRTKYSFQQESLPAGNCKSHIAHSVGVGGAHPMSWPWEGVPISCLGGTLSWLGGTRSRWYPYLGWGYPYPETRISLGKCLGPETGVSLGKDLGPEDQQLG